MVKGNKFKQQAAAAQQLLGTTSATAKQAAAASGSSTVPANGSLQDAQRPKRRKRRRSQPTEQAAAGAHAPHVQPAETVSSVAVEPPQSKRRKRSRRGRGHWQQTAAADLSEAQQPAANGHAPQAAPASQRPNSSKSFSSKPVELPRDRPDSAAVRRDASGSTATAGPQTVPNPSATQRFAALLGAYSAAPAGSNWAALKAQLAAAPPPHRRQRKRPAEQQEAEAPAPEGAQALPPRALSDDASPTPVVAVDCEMVGVGPDGARSQLARVCIVNNHGAVLMDKFARPKERVTDFRTRYSGIRPADIKHAPPFEAVQREAAALLQGRVIVGHSISNDLKALLLGHPEKAIRDTARYPPLMLPRKAGGKARARGLRALAAEQLGLTIQEGEHSPVDDARAALYLYHKHRKVWEGELKHFGSVKRLRSLMAGAGRKTAAQSLSDLATHDAMVDL